MIQEEKYAAHRYINVTFPAGTSSFSATNELLPLPTLAFPVRTSGTYCEAARWQS